MFKGMYDLINKTKNKRVNEKVALQKDAAPVLSPEELLNTEKRQQTLQDIRGLLNLPDEEYNHIFLSVIHNFAAFVQNLPETERSYYSSLGGFLDHALERASLSLFLCRTYLLPEGTTLASLSEEEMLWVYAVFTAALLLDVGKIVTKHIITLTDAEGNAIRSWLPYTGPMIGQASHYIFGFSEEHYDHMRRLITPLLARQILPAGAVPPQNENSEESGGGDAGSLPFGGFNWLASDPEVLESWLAMLSDEQRQVGSILTVIPLADAQLLEGYFTDRKVFRHALSPQTIAFLNKLNKERKEYAQKLKELRDKLLAEHAEREPDKSAEKAADSKNVEQKTARQSLFGFPSLSQQDRAQKAALTVAASMNVDNIRRTADNFAQWMKENIEKGKIVYNATDASVQMTDNKVFISQQLLQDYLSNSKNLDISSANDLRAILLQSELLRVVSPAEVIRSPYLITNISGYLVAQNPNLVLPVGIAQSLHLTGQPPQPPAQPVSQQPTAQEAYEQQQQKQQHQQQLLQNIPRAVPPGTPRGR